MESLGGKLLPKPALLGERVTSVEVERVAVGVGYYEGRGRRPRRGERVRGVAGPGPPALAPPRARAQGRRPAVH